MAQRNHPTSRTRPITHRLRPLTLGTNHLGRDAIRRLVTRHTATASDTCPTLRDKNVTPHVLRHTCAMQLLRAGIDTAVIALILGHANVTTTQVYLQADQNIKQDAMARITPPDVEPGRYRPSDDLLAFLEGL
ncbi:MAG: tyrosine-type recombinase/integrase [bacterium]|nr:tyrosine-type recombinase/integrase [bacterium]MCP4959342.1 tyrosine-type recombinase/integrase [Actinomycetes bacterium]